jgi:hypothetical protein
MLHDVEMQRENGGGDQTGYGEFDSLRNSPQPMHQPRSSSFSASRMTG